MQDQENLHETQVGTVVGTEVGTEAGTGRALGGHCHAHTQLHSGGQRTLNNIFQKDKRKTSDSETQAACFGP